VTDLDVLRRRYARLNGERATQPMALSRLESRLEVALPADFRRIAEFFNGSGINTLPLYSIDIDDGTWSVVEETLRLRAAIALPKVFVVLAEPPESLIVMNCAKGGSVLWIDATDAGRLATGEALRNPDEWPCFADFFAHVLEEEELDREESRSVS
jgi:hypothetical protein